MSAMSQKSNSEKKAKILVILGPTASGKSDLAVTLARHFNGEVISADSRQVYTGLNLGTGKITKREMRGVPHHLLDVANPKRRLTVDLYKKMTDTVIAEIIARGKLPILCGGTGFYIQAVVDNLILPNVPADAALREKLASKTSLQLVAELRRLDPKRAAEVDPYNQVRLIRSIEIARALGKVPELKSNPRYAVLQIGLETAPELLKEKIHTRLLKRLKLGMIKEARHLHDRGLSWKRMEELGLEYRYLALYLQGKISREQLVEQLGSAIWHFVRHQITWFKRDARIKWFKLSRRTEQKKIERTIARFLRD